MAKPIKVLNRIYDITPEYIKEKNIKGILVDMDNTLLKWSENVVGEESKNWLEAMENAGAKVCIITNSGIERASLVLNDINYQYIHSAFKPFPFGFIKGRKMLGVKKENILVVGDQMVTDGLGSKIVGYNCIIVEPMSLKEQKGTYINRFFERLIFGRDVRDKNNNE